MRKFRALSSVQVGANLFEKQFIYGGVYVHDDICTYIVAKDFEFKTIYKETLGQFTGMKDRNDVEIFEGDIVVCDSLVWPQEVYYVDEVAMFRLGRNDDDYGDFTLYDSGDFEVIGNMHQNPELINAEH